MGVDKKTRKALEGLKEAAHELSKRGISVEERERAQARFDQHLKAANAGLDKSMDTANASIRQSVARMAQMGNKISEQVDMALDLFESSPGLTSDVVGAEADVYVSQVMDEIRLEEMMKRDQKAEIDEMERRIAELKAFTAEYDKRHPTKSSSEGLTSPGSKGGSETEEDDFEAFCEKLEADPEFEASTSFNLVSSLEDVYEAGLQHFEESIAQLEVFADDTHERLDEALDALAHSAPAHQKTHTRRAADIIHAVEKKPEKPTSLQSAAHAVSQVRAAGLKPTSPGPTTQFESRPYFSSTGLINQKTSENIFTRAAKTVGKWFSQLRDYVMGEKEELTTRKTKKPTYSGPPVTPQSHQENLEGVSVLLQDQRTHLNKAAQKYRKAALKSSQAGKPELAKQQLLQARKLEAQQRKYSQAQRAADRNLRQCNRALQGWQRAKARVERHESRGISKK